jgi:dipeptidyl aminopeptidase/acylaminoacyl peptidase
MRKTTSAKSLFVQWVFPFFVVSYLLMTLDTSAVIAQEAKPKPATRSMQIEDLFRFQRVSEPQLRPQGDLVVYQVTNVDLEGNKSSTSLWLASVGGKTSQRQLTNPQGKSDRHPRWSPDGKSILFESSRSGANQLWMISLDGGEAKQITTLNTGASTGIWSHDGSHIAFVSSVYPEFSELPLADSDAKNKSKSDETEKNPVKAKVFGKLFYRHWDSYVEDRRQHLFVCKADGSECRDVTPGDRDGYPTSTTFSVGDDFTFTPDGKSLIFTAAPATEESWSTNYDLCRVTIDNKSVQWETLTPANKAADVFPKFSPDGSKLAYRAQSVAGYEADKWELMLVDVDSTGKFTSVPRSLTASLDRSCDEFTWVSKDKLIFTAEEKGARMIYAVGSEEGKPYAISGEKGQITSLSAGKGLLVYSKALMNAPAEIFQQSLVADSKVVAFEGKATQLSQANTAMLSELNLPRPESVEVPVEGDVNMQMWILKPPGFDPSKRWPIAYLVHGGPQSAWEDGWSYRWCPQLWAAQGYVVVLPNPRGSTGFGQKYVNDISGDWGGKCYRDLMAGIDYIEKQPWTDSTRIGSAGASFGGYMMNWFAVNTGRFQCLITHCSVWNFESMWGTTDEQWFDEYEHGGLPWDKPEKYREYSPHTKAGNLGKFKTPMLVIHNDLDFRCPIGQGHELFTSLQRLGVPSRMVNFPDEGHWVSKPANSRYWHQEVFAWLAKYVPPGGR